MSVQVKFNKKLNKDDKSQFSLDISFRVNNSITVLVGPSGSGKTTTLKIIAGILNPDEGNIVVGSETYFDSEKGINIPIRDRRIGFVFQDYALFPHMNAEQNIAYGIKERDSRIRSEKAREMLGLFRIEHVGHHLPSEMSGGEQQRVALARALASDPAIVLLDEPLSAVDMETRLGLLDEVISAQERFRIPFIYVTHNLEEADRLGSERISLNNGKVLERQDR